MAMMDDNGKFSKNEWYRENMGSKPNSGSTSAKGTGEMANIPIKATANTDNESLGDVAARLKKQKAQAAANAKSAPVTAPATTPKTDTPPTPKKAPIPASLEQNPSYKKGTDYVPKTGKATLHEGEAVLPKAVAEKYRSALVGLAGNDALESKPPKKLKEMRIRRATNGGHIIEHHHTEPSMHPMEEHTTTNLQDLMNHMANHMPEEEAEIPQQEQEGNPGE